MNAVIGGFVAFALLLMAIALHGGVRLENHHSGYVVVHTVGGCAFTN